MENEEAVQPHLLQPHEVAHPNLGAGPLSSPLKHPLNMLRVLMPASLAVHPTLL